MEIFMASIFYINFSDQKIVKHLGMNLKMTDKAVRVDELRKFWKFGNYMVGIFC